jgi:hypothetical protein
MRNEPWIVFMVCILALRDVLGVRVLWRLAVMPAWEVASEHLHSAVLGLK